LKITLIYCALNIHTAVLDVKLRKLFKGINDVVYVPDGESFISPEDYSHSSSMNSKIDR